MAKVEPIMPTEINPLQPSSLVVVSNDGTSHKFDAEKYNDLMWLYTEFTKDRGKYRSVTLYYCTGQKLIPQLVVGVRLVGEGCKDPVHYESSEARALHERNYMET